jgi:phosphatidylserine decarboxylase
VKHSGRAAKAATLLLAKTIGPAIVLAIALWLLWPGISWIPTTLAGLAVVFTGFVLWFFRDPEPQVPADSRLVVAPAHGKVDVIDRVPWPTDPNRTCQRISIFLSVFDVHIQQAPVAGRVDLVRHTPGLFLNALKTESAAHNENVLLCLTAADPAGTPIAVRLIAGLIARRILPWAVSGETVARGERISLIQFGSRVDLYLPLNAALQIQVGTRVTGGETVVARL